MGLVPRELFWQSYNAKGYSIQYFTPSRLEDPFSYPIESSDPKPWGRSGRMRRKGAFLPRRLPQVLLILPLALGSPFSPSSPSFSTTSLVAPSGIEDSVRTGGGPLLGFLIFPLLWSLPEALIIAELTAAFSSPFLAFQEGFLKWISGTLDNALYPAPFLDYLCHSLPFFSNPLVRSPTLLYLTAGLTYLNYRGLHLVGISAVALAAFSLSPFLVLALALALLAAPRIKPSRWLAINPSRIDLRGYFNSMFWDLNFWDKASTLAPGRWRTRALNC